MQNYINKYVKEKLIPSTLCRKQLNEDEKKAFMSSLSLFSYGSTVYKHKHPDDYDYIVVLDENIQGLGDVFCEDKEGAFSKIEKIDDVFCVKGETVSIQITFYTFEEFISMIESNEITALECLSLMCVSIFIENEDILFDISKNLFTYRNENDFFSQKKLRSSISKKASNSYVKAKKKLIIEEDFHLKTSLKSLWHSFRMVGFGLQMAMNRTSEIDYFDIANDLYLEMAEDYLDYSSFKTNEAFWQFIHEKYQPRHNALMSLFRQYALKEGESNKPPLTKEELHNIVNKGYLVNPMSMFDEKIALNNPELGIKNGELPF